jgi:hypothetical protein
LSAEELVYPWLDWLTAPSFDPELRIETGALMLVCFEVASLEAFCVVVFSLLAVWTCFTRPPTSPPLLLPASAVPGVRASAHTLAAIAMQWRFIRYSSFQELRIDFPKAPVKDDPTPE